VERLHRDGHRHMAFLLTDQENTSVVDRAKGWREAVKQLGLDERDTPILRYRGAPGVPPENVEGGRMLAEQILRDGLPGTGAKPTAIVGLNDWCALGVLRATQALGVRVPEQLSVIGFDSTRVGDGTTPPLCSYSPRFIDMGRQAAGLLASAMRDEAEQPRRVRIPVDFVRRGSCGPAPQ